MAKIYVIRAGALDDDKIVYDNVVGFTTRRVAETVLRRARAESPYLHQYDEVEELNVYETEGRWKRGLKVVVAKKAAKAAGGR